MSGRQGWHQWAAPPTAPPALPAVPDVAQAIKILDKYGEYNWIRLFQSEKPDVLHEIFERLLLFSREDSTGHSSLNSDLRSDIRASFATCSSLQSDARKSCRWSRDSTPGRSFRSSTSSAPPPDEPFNEIQEAWHSNVPHEPTLPDIIDAVTFSTRARNHPSNDPEGRYFCTNGFCKTKEEERGRRSSHRRHVERHWSWWYCPDCLSQGKVQEVLKEIGCRCDVAIGPDWYHLEFHRLQLEQDGHESLVRQLKKVLSTATYTRQANLGNHLKGAHGIDSQNARGCMIPLRRFATCGICEDDILFTNYKAEESHLWNVHWQKGHSMDMWITDHEIWKLISLRPGVYEAWQHFVQQDYPSSKQDHVSWKHLSPTDMKLLRFGLEGDFLDDHQIARMAFEKARLFLNVSASQVCRGPAHSIGASRQVYSAESNNNDRGTSNGQAGPDGPIPNSKKQAQKLQNYEIPTARPNIQPNCPPRNESRRDMTSLLEDVPTITQDRPAPSNFESILYTDLQYSGTQNAIAPTSLSHTLLREQERLKTRNTGQLMLAKELPPTPADTEPFAQGTIDSWGANFQQTDGLDDVIRSP